jgi:hypothetical protein
VDAGILILERPPDDIVKRLASDSDARRSPEHVQDVRRAGFATLPRRAHQINVLVAALVASHANEGHHKNYFRFEECEDFFAGLRLGAAFRVRDAEAAVRRLFVGRARWRRRWPFVGLARAAAPAAVLVVLVVRPLARVAQPLGRQSLESRDFYARG